MPPLTNYHVTYGSAESSDSVNMLLEVYFHVVRVEVLIAAVMKGTKTKN
jgi:hypothetical protein